MIAVVCSLIINGIAVQAPGHVVAKAGDLWMVEFREHTFYVNSNRCLITGGLHGKQDRQDTDARSK